MKRKTKAAILFLLMAVCSSIGGKNSLGAAGEPESAKVNPYPQDIIVYTAHQEWLSRIYLLEMDGSLIDYFEYSFYYLADLEVVDNQVYVSEAFAPRMYQVDLYDGTLNLVIDDWSLYYFYDLAFDGTYFYLNEWDLNRYDFYGDKDGTASFDESVYGGAWDGSYYWTLTDAGQVKCWDISAWPTVVEVPENNFAPPSSNCCGLWFDGQHFWTAESIDGVLGHIYQFNYRGAIVNQWLEPAFMGWSACVIKASDYPHIPRMPSGPTEGETGVEYCYSATTTDPEENSVLFWFDWGDGTDTGWLGPYLSGDTCTICKAWMESGEFGLKVKAKDINDYESDWSDALEVSIIDRGDCNSDGLVDLDDAIFLLNYLFREGSPPDPLWTGDCNCDQFIELGDAIHLLNYLFRGGPPPSC